MSMIPDPPPGGAGPRAPTGGPAWRPATHAEPCPVCEKPTRCKVAPGGDRVMCFRHESPDPMTGGQAWFHPHPDGPTSHRTRSDSGPKATFRPPPTDFGKLAAQYAGELTPARTAALAAALGLPVEVFGLLPLLGWNTDAGGAHWTFPEVDPAGGPSSASPAATPPATRARSKWPAASVV